MAIDTYLDIEESSYSENDLYFIVIYIQDSAPVYYIGQNKKLNIIINEEEISSLDFSMFSSGFSSLVNLDKTYNSMMFFLYNDITKTYNLGGVQELEYEGTTDYFMCLSYSSTGVNDAVLLKTEEYNAIFTDNILPVTHFTFIGSFSPVYRIIVRDNGKLSLMVFDTKKTIYNYEGNKLNDLKDKNVYGLFYNNTPYYIFIVAKNIYIYNGNDTFNDDNIILFGILPNIIENISIGIIMNLDQPTTLIGLTITDIDNHIYYKGYFTDTPPTPTPTSYIIRFLNYDGSVLETKEVEEGTTPSYTGVAPTREGYTFTGWTPTPYPADKNQDYTAEFEQSTRNITINYKVSNSEETFFTSKISNVTNPITKIEIDTTLVFSVTFYESDGREHPTSYSGLIGGESTLPYIESYNYKESIYLANKLSTEPTEIITNDSTEEITIIFNVGENYHYKIQFVDRSVSPGKQYQVQRLLAGETPIYSGTTPTKEGYTFTGRNPELYPADKNQDYNAIFEVTPIDYTLTFKDSNNEPFTPTTFNFKNYINRILFNNDLFGNTYIYIEDLEGNKTINFLYTNKSLTTRITLKSIIINGITYNQLNTYFDVDIKGNTEIILNTDIEYYIDFRDYNEIPLQNNWVKKGTTPIYTGLNPSRIGYNFTGWTPTPYPADKSQKYIATYEIAIYTINFLDEDGNILETKQVNYGETPIYNGEEPTKEGYTFIGWSPKPYPATQNQDYSPVFRSNAFSVNLYKNTAENNRVDKTNFLTSVGEVSGYLREETSIVNPVILIQYDKVIDFNYIYISTFNRYYFVTEVTSFRTNLWRLTLKCDVLMSYKDTILDYSCYISRNEYDFDNYIEDNYLPLKYNKEKEVELLYDDTYHYGDIFFSGICLLINTIYSGTKDVININEIHDSIFANISGSRYDITALETGSSNFRITGVITKNIKENLNKIIDSLINNSDLASYIINIFVYPVSFSNLNLGTSTTNDTKLYVKDDNSSITLEGDLPISYPSNSSFAPLHSAQFNIEPKFNNYLDYEPYTKYELYLPFYGWLEVKSFDILNTTISVWYILSSDSNSGSIIVAKGDVLTPSTEVIAEVQCQVGLEMPVNSSNKERVDRQKSANMLNTVVGTISGVGMTALGVATANPLLIGGGVAGTVGSITSGISKDMTMIPNAQSKVGDSYAGLFGDRCFRLRRTYSQLAIDDINKYAKYIGRPCQETRTLNDLFGYTIVGGVHVENLPTATENEKTEIESLLRKGVILKDKTN